MKKPEYAQISDSFKLEILQNFWEKSECLSPKDRVKSFEEILTSNKKLILEADKKEKIKTEK